MKGEELFGLLNDLDEEYIAEAAQPRRRSRRWVKWGALAACLCAAVIGVAAFTMEAQAYQEAADFFTAHGLSTEGLTRAEIKEVYRDITTERFSNVKTAEVLLRSNRVPGVEIAQNAPDRGDAAALWEALNSGAPKGVRFAWRVEYVMDETLGFEVCDKSYFEKYDGDKLLWQTVFTGFVMEDWAPAGEGALVWGRTPTWSSEQTSMACLALVDGEGNVVWQKGLVHGYRGEFIAAAVDNGDGSWAVFSRGDLRDLVISQFDADGAETMTGRTDIGSLGVWKAARLGEDYIVQLGSYTENTERLVKVTRDGEVTDAFSYGTDGLAYYITDMADFGGRLYLSACAVPRQPREDGNGGRFEIDGVLRAIYEKGAWEVSPDEVLALLRANYTAVLLVCDPDSGAPETFYQVPGCRGGALEAGDTLRWDVESFSDAFFSPATSSFSIGGSCQVFRYAFDGKGALVSQEKTGETVAYRR